MKRVLWVLLNADMLSHSKAHLGVTVERCKVHSVLKSLLLMSSSLTSSYSLYV